MQSQILFNNRELLDWYTEYDDNNNELGKGSFGVVVLAYDDRALLLQLKANYTNTPLPEIIMENEYQLIDTNFEQGNMTDTLQIMGYLSTYSGNAIIEYAMQHFKNVNFLHIASRYNLIKWSMLEIYNIPYNEIENVLANLPIQVLVAIKIMKKSKNTKNVENIAKTEIFALSQVSSNTPTYIINDDKNVIEILNGVENCFEYLGTPLINCMNDYFKSVDDIFYISLAYVNGYDLYEIQKHNFELSNTPKPFASIFIWYTAWMMLQALQFIHTKNIIHNDVKLENIMYNKDTHAVVLLDFGLACHSSIGNGKARDSCDTNAGTPDYAPPEMARSKKRYPVSDIWSLGVVLWEMATGISYRAGDDFQEIMRNIRNGYKPNLKSIKPYEMWHYESFISLLSSMFENNIDDRITAAQALARISNTFNSFANINDPDALGRWFQLHCCLQGYSLDPTSVSSTHRPKRKAVKVIRVDTNNELNNDKTPNFGFLTPEKRK